MSAITGHWLQRLHFLGAHPLIDADVMERVELPE